MYQWDGWPVPPIRPEDALKLADVLDTGGAIPSKGAPTTGSSLTGVFDLVSIF